MMNKDTKTPTTTDMSVTKYDSLLVDFPYIDKTGKYTIHKRHQRKSLWRQFFDPISCFYSGDKNEMLWKCLLWLGVILAFCAIIVSLIKELDEGDENIKDDVILHLSIIELTLTLIAVFITIIKHILKYNCVIQLQKNLKTALFTNDTKKKQITNRMRVFIIIFVLWIASLIATVIAFLVLHFKDRDSHKDLIYTKYSTTITLFIALALDSIVNDLMGEAYLTAKCDQYKLLVHQLGAELKTNLLETKKHQRIEEIDRYLNSSELCKLDDHFRYYENLDFNHGRRFVVDRTTIGRVNPSYERHTNENLKHLPKKYGDSISTKSDFFNMDKNQLVDPTKNEDQYAVVVKRKNGVVGSTPNLENDVMTESKTSKVGATTLSDDVIMTSSNDVDAFMNDSAELDTISDRSSIFTEEYFEELIAIANQNAKNTEEIEEIRQESNNRKPPLQNFIGNQNQEGFLSNGIKNLKNNEDLGSHDKDKYVESPRDGFFQFAL